MDIRSQSLQPGELAPAPDGPSPARGPPIKAFNLGILVRLALVNSIGYAGSTIVPLWVGGIGAHLGMAAWFGGAVATGQLATAALFNLLTPFLFPTFHPARLARFALAAATLVYPFALIGSPLPFVLALVGGGACLGVVLNGTNRIIAGSAEVQKGYSIFLLTEGVFSASVFYSGATLWRHFGLNAVFVTLPVVTLAGALIMTSLRPSELALPPRMMNVSPKAFGLFATLGLVAMFGFFCGQSSITAATITLGRAAGLSAQAASAALAIVVLFGLSGAAASRLIGERFGLRQPLLVATLVLACVVTVMTHTPTPVVFVIGIMWVQVTTLFIVPYFLTLLARLDDTGRAASVGPACLLGGVAVGPSVAAWVMGHWTVAELGPAAGAALLISALLTVAATRGLQSGARD